MHTTTDVIGRLFPTTFLEYGEKPGESDYRDLKYTQFFCDCLHEALQAFVINEDTVLDLSL